MLKSKFQLLLGVRHICESMVDELKFELIRKIYSNLKTTSFSDNVRSVDEQFLFDLNYRYIDISRYTTIKCQTFTYASR